MIAEQLFKVYLSMKKILQIERAARRGKKAGGTRGALCTWALEALESTEGF